MIAIVCTYCLQNLQGYISVHLPPRVRITSLLLPPTSPAAPAIGSLPSRRRRANLALPEFQSRELSVKPSHLPPALPIWMSPSPPPQRLRAASLAAGRLPAESA